MFARLDSAQRSDALASLGSTRFDVLVVGGGVVGAGAALDAASRGLSVALVEAHDWAAGTSSRSSKLVHGGLRYLEQLEFKLVREALRERGLLLRRLAPHLVRPVPFLFPLKSLWERLYVGAGVVLYDSIGGAGAVPMHRHLSRRRALSIGPSLRASFAGAVRYYDAQMDDARLVLTLVRTAVQHGATVLSRARVVSLLRDGSTVVGARVSVDGAEVDVRARRVIGATGVWTDSLTSLSPVPAPFRVRMSKGVHILVPRDRIALDGGLITRTEKSVLFVIPWGSYWIIGTTDTPFSGDPASVSATAEDVAYLLEHVNSWLCTPLFASDVVGTYAGLRPLLDGAGHTTQLSREHAVAEVEPGFFVIAGGKYTTYRVMAADVVDSAVRGLGSAVAPSLTARLPLCGAVGYQEMWDNRASIASAAGLALSTVEHLLGRYGSATSELLAMIEQDPALASPLAAEYLAVEALYAVTHEGALDLDDVLSRRLRLAIEVPDRGAGVAGQVADLISGPLGWSDGERDAAVEAYQVPAWT